MPCNITNNIIYNTTLSEEVINKALIKTSEIILNFFNISQCDAKITSALLKKEKHKNAIVFSAMVKSLVNNTGLDKNIIEDAFLINITEDKRNTLGLLAKKIHDKYSLDFSYVKEYSTYYNQGLSLFLLVLHFKKIITLPFIFKIPYVRVKNGNILQKVDLGINNYPLMLKQLREQQDESTSFLSKESHSILSSYGTKLFIALGWNNFDDVNIHDLIYFRDNANNTIKVFNNNRPPYAAFINFLHTKNPLEFNFNINNWQKSLSDTSKRETESKKLEKIITKDNSNFSYLFEADSLDKVVPTKLFYLRNLEKIKKYNPLYESSIEHWTVLEKTYLTRLKLESYKSINTALGYWNMYLFLILPNWYKKNKTEVIYPKEAKDIKAGIFITNFIEDKKIKPPTFSEFLNKVQNTKEIKNESVYIVYKSLEKFFDFIETYSEELPGCSGFKQPISSFDYPKITRSLGTNKGLIPRHVFPILINYIEAISQYNAIINDKLLNGEDIQHLFKGDFIDVKSLENLVQFVPIVCTTKKIIPLRYIPNLLDIKATALKDGKILNINYPHLLNHILVILQTGIRSNHIQWLDAEKFDYLVKDDENSFSSLFVNTDKARNQGWTPVVHKRVIEVLRNQLKWRSLVNNLEFNKKKFYNNNTKTKWGQFYPLFSYTKDGLPYSDDAYSKVWLKILIYFESFLKGIDINLCLVKLLPPKVRFNEFNLDAKLESYGKSCEHICELRWTSDITPHSARVSVISHYITALPADIIGQYITGQTEAVVHHYVKLDPNYLTELERGQKDGLAKMAIEKEFDRLNGKEKIHPIFADKENSNLAKSLAMNKQETIAQYGCISLSLKEEGKTGIDFLLEEDNKKIAFNKTEICPCNNNCPPDLIKELKGIRRCGICPYAVRSIDHLPAIAVKKRQVMELLEEIEAKLTEANMKDSYSMEELDSLEEERQRITEELLGWIISEEMLEANRRLMADKQSSITYVVKKPEILIEKLQQVTKKEGDIEYLLTRLKDCESFPNLDTPLVKARFDLLRRKLLAQLNDFKGAFDSKIPIDPAQECLGVIREVVKRFGLSHDQTIALLSTNMLGYTQDKPLLEINYGKD